ncbi:MAG: heme A synthase [Rhodospirillaceae bacterium]|nr:heme A synthase [Rhodospirillaceae bacterium]
MSVGNTAQHANRNRIMAVWLFVVAAMVFAMVVLGGVTRLTHSGLSMVEWKPLTGWLPPFSDADWQILFEKYQAFPEFQKVNADMSLSGFKGIFWLEFLHRLWGRTIGLAFFLPFVFFLAWGWVRWGLGLKFAAMFVVGGLQGVLGWYMVKSGLVDRPDVSQYRLAAHLILALVIYAYILWVAIQLWHDDDFPAAEGALVPWSVGLVVLVFVTAFSGALVAGLDAGLTYNTFPLMDGDLVPDGMLEMTPAYINLFENVTTVQFDHRVLAEVTFLVVILLWFRGRRLAVQGGLSLALNWLMGLMVMQVTLGISTLLLVVPVPLAAMHQAGAVLLLGAAVWTLREAVGSAN